MSEQSIQVLVGIWAGSLSAWIQVCAHFYTSNKKRELKRILVGGGVVFVLTGAWLLSVAGWPIPVGALVLALLLGAVGIQVRRRTGVGLSVMLVGCFGVVVVFFAIIGLFAVITARFYPQFFAAILEPVLATPTPTVKALATPTPIVLTPPTPTPIAAALPKQTPSSIVPTPTRAVPPLFEDNFDAGPRSEWEALSGEWGTAGGKYTLLSIAERPAVGIAVVGDASWDNYAIECDVTGFYDEEYDEFERAYGDELMNEDRRLGAIYGYPEYSRAAILIGMDDDGNAAGFIIGATFMEWGLLKEWNWTVISGTLIEGYGERGGHIRITVRGSFYEVWAKDKVVTSISSPGAHKGGRVGIWLKASNNLSASDWRAVPKIDNFSVTPLE